MYSRAAIDSSTISGGSLSSSSSLFFSSILAFSWSTGIGWRGAASGGSSFFSSGHPPSGTSSGVATNAHSIADVVVTS